MNITWHGYSCFKIQDSGRGRDVTIVTDPFKPEGKQKLPRNLSADILLVSHDHPHHNNVSAVGGNPFVIKGPGEFEVKEVIVNGVSTFHDDAEGKEKGENTMFYIFTGGIHMLFVGDLNHSLEAKHFNDLHEIDVLFLPVGGDDVLSPKKAADLVGQLEPRVIIPMHYKVGDFCPKHEGIGAFFKEMGISKIEPVSKAKLSEKDLPQDEMQIIVLDPQ